MQSRGGIDNYHCPPTPTVPKEGDTVETLCLCGLPQDHFGTPVFQWALFVPDGLAADQQQQAIQGLCKGHPAPKKSISFSVAMD